MHRDTEIIQLEIELSASENSVNYWYSRCMEAERVLTEQGILAVEYDVSDEGATD